MTDFVRMDLGWTDILTSGEGGRELGPSRKTSHSMKAKGMDLGFVNHRHVCSSIHVIACV